ncbi:MAG: class I SAM-dependent methyltransferase [Candidatus Zixiibacteriota bacterium]
MDIPNVYDDSRRAETYAKLEFPGTYYLAYRDIPDIIAAHVTGRRALDFGCGTGRSTRFLKRLGFATIGIDISAEMVRQAMAQDPDGDYRLTDADGNLWPEESSCDLVLSAFTFDNVPTVEQKIGLLTRLRRLLTGAGRIVNLVSSPEIYTHEWASFSTVDFPENQQAKSGDRVRIIITDTEDPRPVEDVVFSPEDYQRVYTASGLQIEATYKPLAHPEEPYRWVNETKIAPWTIYVLKSA